MQTPRQIVLTLMIMMVAALLAVGCASIMKGSKHKVTVNSTPAAASVVIKTAGGMTMFEGRTPATAELSKKDEYIVTISHDGYKEKIVNITKDGIEGWFWGNIICGGIIGIVVDVTSGAMNRLKPDQISVELATAHVPGQGDQLYVLFLGLDSHGQLRQLAVPLEREISPDLSIN